MSWYDRLLALQFSWRDGIDIVIVAFVIYNILALIRGTRAMQVSIGMVLLGSTFFVARAFNLPALEAISRQILFYLPFAVIVLFQAEIRRALARMASNPLLSLFPSGTSPVPFDVILDAAKVLSANRIGALIAIERTQSLRMYSEAAKPVDAIATAELLISIFTPGGPLHDGAVIVRGNRIVAAGAFLPLTTSADPKLAHGTRHRAALGLSEDSDALVIVISEENGSMAATSEGVLHEHLDSDQLAQLMQERLRAR
ncbi:MAG TPA: diadenylate cyclase CdaA [Thermoanaerobaculia bacterium]|jgi:diadenylate cyclase|nr:diadenylate cyclase CdaA [Thermoanaerobaculia bacterium]